MMSRTRRNMILGEPMFAHSRFLAGIHFHIAVLLPGCLPGCQAGMSVSSASSPQPSANSAAAAIEFEDSGTVRRWARGARGWVPRVAMGCWGHGARGPGSRDKSSPVQPSPATWMISIDSLNSRCYPWLIYGWFQQISMDNNHRESQWTISMIGIHGYPRVPVEIVSTDIHGIHGYP